jgi:flagellar hook-associated protein 2
MAISATGLGSGLDITGLVKQLVDAERAGSDLQLNREGAKLSMQLSALGSFKGAMATFQTSLAAINNVQSFSKRSITSSDAASISATATDAAVPNNYNLQVSQLADVHALASTSFADASSTVGTGTLTFRFGKTDYNGDTDSYNSFALNPDSKVTTLTIDSSNNTLQGVMEAINAADFGVSASIVNAGDGYKLLMTSEKTGLKNSLEISVSDADNNNTDTGSSAGLSNFVFNSSATNMQQTAAAKDAMFSVNGLAVTSADNNVKNAIAGVDLTLRKTTTGPVTVAVKHDTASALASVQGFITGYNNFIKTINTLTAYDATKKSGGPLMGDFSVRAVVSQSDSILRNMVGGLTGEVTSLTDIGIKTNKDGTFTLDTAMFNEVLQEAPKKLPALFSAAAAATDPNISYNSATANAKVGNYAVNITALASAGSFTGGSVLPDFTPGNYLTIDSNNNAFSVEIDGVPSGSLTLTNGTYESGEALASEIQARINGASNITEAEVGVKVTYDASNGRLDIVSDSVGSTSSVKILSAHSNMAASLGISVSDGVPGQNVSGTIGGLAALGKGTVLTGATGTAVEGLALNVGGEALGARGSVNFTRGVANQLNEYLKKILDSEGSLEDRIETVVNRQAAVAERREKQELRWAAVKDRYTTQFNALDSLMMKLNATGSFLEGQLKSLPGVVFKSD